MNATALLNANQSEVDMTKAIQLLMPTLRPAFVAANPGISPIILKMVAEGKCVNLVMSDDIVKGMLAGQPVTTAAVAGRGGGDFCNCFANTITFDELCDLVRASAACGVACAVRAAWAARGFVSRAHRARYLHIHCMRAACICSAPSPVLPPSGPLPPSAVPVCITSLGATNTSTCTGAVCYAPRCDCAAAGCRVTRTVPSARAMTRPACAHFGTRASPSTPRATR